MKSDWTIYINDKSKPEAQPRWTQKGDQLIMSQLRHGLWGMCMAAESYGGIFIFDSF